jgi:hypothetical protein
MVSHVGDGHGVPTAQPFDHRQPERARREHAQQGRHRSVGPAHVVLNPVQSLVHVAIADAVYTEMPAEHLADRREHLLQRVAAPEHVREPQEERLALVGAAQGTVHPGVLDRDRGA